MSTLATDNTAVAAGAAGEAATMASARASRDEGRRSRRDLAVASSRVTAANTAAATTPTGASAADAVGTATIAEIGAVPGPKASRAAVSSEQEVDQLNLANAGSTPRSFKASAFRGRLFSSLHIPWPI
jgi:hypothetical protein